MKTQTVLDLIKTKALFKQHEDFGKIMWKLMKNDLFELMGDEYDITRVEAEKPHIKEVLNTLSYLLSYDKIKARHSKDILTSAWKTDAPEWDIEKYIVDSKMFEEVSLDGIIEEVIAEEPKAWEDFVSGKEKVIGRLIGRVMKKTNGKADPEEAKELFKVKIK